MIFPKYIETCELLLDYPKIGGGNIEDFAKNTIRNILRENIYLHSRRLIAEFPGYGIKCIENLQSHFANVTFLTKLDMTRFFSKSHIK